MDPALRAVERIPLFELRTRQAGQRRGPLKAPARSGSNGEPKQTPGAGGAERDRRAAVRRTDAGKGERSRPILPDAAPGGLAGKPGGALGRLPQGAEGSERAAGGTHPAGGRAAPGRVLGGAGPRVRTPVWTCRGGPAPGL